MKISNVLGTLVSWFILLVGFILSSQAAVILYLVSSGQFQPGEFIYGDLEVPTISDACLRLLGCLAILALGLAGRAEMAKDARKAA